MTGLEPATRCLQNSCSTTELHRPLRVNNTLTLTAKEYVSCSADRRVIEGSPFLQPEHHKLLYLDF